MKDAFIPPSIEYPLNWFLDFAFPAIAKLALNIESVEITEEDKSLLRSLKKERVLYMSNHPTTIEPPVAFFVANVMGSRFKYMASRPVFDWGFGMVGELIKRVGAFSVLAGGADRESIKMARNILAEKEGKLVIYPEGMNGLENDNLLPFQPGASQIGFWAYEDVRKKNPEEDVLMLPSFVRYLQVGSKESIHQEIESSITKIERTLGANPGSRNLLRRFLMIGRILLENVEREFGIDYEPEKPMDYRIGRVRHAVLNKAGEGLGIQFQTGEDAIAKIRELFTAVESLQAGFPSPKAPKETPKNLEQIKKDIERAYTFIVIRPEYLISRPTPERFMEWIYRFENIVLGATHYRPRKANVSFAKPISFKENYEAYRKDKKATVLEITQKLRQSIEDQLIKTLELSSPLVTPFDAGEDLKIWGIKK
ncbi:MAG: 1-acyl-sn-glycerol-3-phosphate acyltransferase [Leptospiraceae bacterium]|nr:1-acyl-sn-glycerol-3-phosphate acyltransferase [Leptospiraceae bacterium]